MVSVTLYPVTWRLTSIMASASGPAALAKDAIVCAIVVTDKAKTLAYLFTYICECSSFA